MSPTTYLFSVDVEDPFSEAGSRGHSGQRLATMVEAYLAFLRALDARATFFVVGQVALRHPALVRRIVAEGHEIACHSDSHVPLDRLGRASFRDDIRRNLDALSAAGAEGVCGYRAPCFSMIQATQWAYPILAEEGFSYSSSVLPARSPLYGWPGFGRRPRMVENMLEMPITLMPWRLLPLPAAGGVYFRVVPLALLRMALRRLRSRGDPVLGYFHPYDIDLEQEDFAHPGFGRWSPYSLLLRANRRAVFPRLEGLLRLGFRIATYEEEARRLRASAPASNGSGKAD